MSVSHHTTFCLCLYLSTPYCNNYTISVVVVMGEDGWGNDKLGNIKLFMIFTTGKLKIYAGQV